MEYDLTMLEKADIVRVLAEALTAEIETIFADKTVTVGADTARIERIRV
jgi:hypothetical protein